MSRARPIIFGDEEIWFDTKINGEKAKASHLEILALVERLDLDDLLDEHISQGKVIERLRDALDQNNIPDDIVQRRKAWREQRRILPECRKCGAQHDSTQHHYVNRWILRELPDYAWKWADRNRNTIPLCIRCHRNLHLRQNGPVSIVEYLNEDEKEFVESAFTALHKAKPALIVLLARGDDSVYESRLTQDWLAHKFSPTEPKPVTAANLREAVA